MPPGAEVHGIALWPPGLETAAMAPRLGIRRGRVDRRSTHDPPPV
jgi:hypothetical protein